MVPLPVACDDFLRESIYHQKNVYVVRGMKKQNVSFLDNFFPFNRQIYSSESYRFSNQIGAKRDIIRIAVIVHDDIIIVGSTCTAIGCGCGCGGGDGTCFHDINVAGAIRQVAIIRGRIVRLSIDNARRQAQGRRRVRTRLAALHAERAKRVFPLHNRCAAHVFIRCRNNHGIIAAAAGSLVFVFIVRFKRIDNGGSTTTMSAASATTTTAATGRNDEIAIVVMLNGLFSTRQDNNDGFARPPYGIVFGRGHHFDTGRV
jgi:hypothetical protein